MESNYTGLQNFVFSWYW